MGQPLRTQTSISGVLGKTEGGHILCITASANMFCIFDKREFLLTLKLNKVPPHHSNDQCNYLSWGLQEALGTWIFSK
jgi:hypothetical protein